MAYADSNYDKLEDEIHELEDDFSDEYGDVLEDVLQKVHDKICPDTDVLFPTAYLAKHYTVTGNDEKGNPIYDVKYPEGVPVIADAYEKEDSRLVILPNPVRIVLLIGAKKRATVWQNPAA